MSARGGYVQSLDRGLAVIRAFDGDHTTLTLSQVAVRSGLSRATARRLLHTLVHLGYATVHAQHFTLRHRILELGEAYLDALTLPRVAGPHLERLVAEVDEPASAAVLDGGDIVYVLRVPAPRPIRLDLGIGARLPARATAMGRVLLAALPEDAWPIDVAPGIRAELADVRDRGWAASEAEPELGLPTVAVPVHGAGGEVVAALNVELSPGDRRLGERADRVLPVLLATARAVSADLADRR